MDRRRPPIRISGIGYTSPVGKRTWLLRAGRARPTAEPVNLTKAEQLYRKAQDGGAVHLVAEIDGAIVGFANVAPETNEISACYAAPNMARRGVGSVLLARMDTIARQAGCDHLTLRASLNAKGLRPRSRLRGNRPRRARIPQRGAHGRGFHAQGLCLTTRRAWLQRALPGRPRPRSAGLARACILIYVRRSTATPR